jgi:hypothetical protein
MLLSAALKPAFKLDDLEDAIWQFDEELKQFGPNLKDLIHNKGKVSILVQCLPSVHHKYDCASMF